MVDILDLIDDAVHDWTVSGDAMRWAPPELNWDQPAISVSRGWRRHSDLEGMDGYAALAYEAFVTQRAMRNIGQGLTRLFDGLRAAIQGWSRQVAPTVQKLAELSQQLQGKTPTRDRPAWQSPYGPPRKGRR